MKKHITMKTLMFLLTLPFAMFIAGCNDDNEFEDAAEDAGEGMEDAAESTGDAVEDATN